MTYKTFEDTCMYVIYFYALSGQSYNYAERVIVVGKMYQHTSIFPLKLARTSSFQPAWPDL